MKYLIKNLIIVFLIFLIISGIFTLLTGPSEKAEEISLSQLVEQINQEKVSRIVVKDGQLEIESKDGSQAKAQKEKETSLTESLKNYGVDSEKLKLVNLEIEEEGGLGLWLGAILPFLLPFLIIGAFLWFMLRGARQGQMQAFSFGRSRARLFTPESQKEKVTFDDVAGLKEAKTELQEIVEFLKNPKKFTELGAKIPKGVLLIGAPGTGKTLLARAVASEAGVPFFHVSGSEFVEMFVGVGSSRVRDLFQTAKKNAPCIIFLDELDAIGRQRGLGFSGAHDEREQTLNQILVEMDGFEPNSGVIILSASITEDTPVLVKQNGEYKLAPIKEVIDSYYQENEEGMEKPVTDLEVLGFEKKIPKRAKKCKHLYFENSAFKKVRSVFRHKVNEIYEVKYRGGIIRTTGNHSLFVRTQWGLKAKPVSQIKPGETLINLPYKATRIYKKPTEIRVHKFNPEFKIELPLWQPLFEPFKAFQFAYQYALVNAGQISQEKIGQKFGISQTAISKWQRGIRMPRPLSRNYFQHRDRLPEKIKFTPELAKLFGYYVAEGYARKEIDFCLHRKEKEKIEEIKNLMRKVFNLTPDKERYITSNAVNIIYYAKPVAKFFAYHCGKGAKNKHIPQFLYETPKEYFIQFFMGYANGDGYSNKKGGLELTSVSKQLILELNWLSRMHGFKGFLTSYVARQGRKITNSGKPLKATQAYRLSFGKTQNPLGPKPGLANVYRPTIKSIKRIPYNGYVYDFCGCENEAFFAGESPILAHNTNRPDVLDVALLRPGRFDRRIILDEPDINDREEVLKIHTRDKHLARDVNLREIAERTPGFSGADLANLVNEAALLAARRDKKSVSQDELRECIEKVLLGPERKSHILSKKEKEIAAYHEAGHALVNASLPHTDPIHKVSIISRGRAAGYTLKLPEEDKHLRSRSEFLDELAVLLGGYTAEELIFNELTTGAASDLKMASELARKLVTQYGMSEKIGPVTFGSGQELAFWGREIPTEKNYSEEVAAQIDKEVTQFIDSAYQTAKKILIEKRAKLNQIAKQLIKKETLERKEFERIMGKMPKRGVAKFISRRKKESSRK